MQNNTINKLKTTLFNRIHVILFIAILLYIPFFAGAYNVYTMYYSYIFEKHSSYYLYTFQYTDSNTSHTIPTKVQFFFAGYKDVTIWLSAFIIASIVSIASYLLKICKTNKKSFLQILVTCLSWTILFMATAKAYIIMLNSFSKHYFSYYLGGTSGIHLFVFGAVYFIIVLPITWLANKIMYKN
jgi:hypothetical protein